MKLADICPETFRTAVRSYLEEAWGGDRVEERWPDEALAGDTAESIIERFEDETRRRGEEGLRRYVLVPLLVNVVLFAGLIWFGSDWISDMVSAQLPEWLEWLTWLLVPLFVFVALAISAFLFNMVAAFVSSPFNGLLAEAVERELTGRRLPGEGGFKRRYQTKAEQIAELEQYLQDLKAEAQAVGEELAHLKRKR